MDSKHGADMRRLDSGLSGLIHKICTPLAWLLGAIIIAIVMQVILRKLGHNQAWLDDLQWWLYGVFVVTGFAYAITTDSHVRVDIFYDKYSIKKKAWIDLFGLGWLLLPFLILMLEILLSYGLSSLAAREGSSSPNGLHKLYILKLSLPALFVIAILAAADGIARGLKTLDKLSFHGWLLAGFPAFWLGLTRIFQAAATKAFRLSNPELSNREIANMAVLEQIPLTVFAVLLIAAALFIIREHVSKKG